MAQCFKSIVALGEVFTHARVLQERDCATERVRERASVGVREREREWPAVSHQTFNEILLKTNTGTAQAAGGSRQQRLMTDPDQHMASITLVNCLSRVSRGGGE